MMEMVLPVFQYLNPFQMDFKTFLLDIINMVLVAEVQFGRRVAMEVKEALTQEMVLVLQIFHHYRLLHQTQGEEEVVILY